MSSWLFVCVNPWWRRPSSYDEEDDLIQQEDTIQLKKNGNKSGFFNNIEECHAVDYTFILQTTSPVVLKLIGIEGHLLWPVVKIPNIVQNVLWTSSFYILKELQCKSLFLCAPV